LEADIDHQIDDIDDEDIPLSQVVAATFKENEVDGFVERIFETGYGLENTAEGENMWSYDNHGNLFSESRELPEMSDAE